MNSFFTWCKNLAEGWKIFFGLVGMVTIIATTAIKVDHWRNKKITHDVRIDKWLITDSLKHEADSTFRDFITLKLESLSDSVRTTNRGVRKLNKINNNMKVYMENKVATKEGLREVQYIFDVEKKNLFYDWIPLDTTQSLNLFGNLK